MMNIGSQLKIAHAIVAAIFVVAIVAVVIGLVDECRVELRMAR